MTPQEALAQALAAVEVHYPLSPKTAADFILAALPEAVREDGHKGHWKLTLWWDPEPAPPIFIEDDS